jgi:diguanylate cyclase (GGDEF)-like protein
MVDPRLVPRGPVLLFLLLAASVPALAGANPALSTYTNAREAHSVTVTEARRGHPVHVRVVVTYYDPYIDTRRSALFVHDSTGSLFIGVPKPLATPLIAGQLIEIAGYSDAGDFAPIAQETSIRVIGESEVPRVAPRVSLSRLMTGEFDGEWVEVEGVVHSVHEYGMNVNLLVAAGDGILSATTVKEAGADYQSLVDATVRIRANAAPVFNGKMQMTGARLFFPNMSQVKVVTPGARDPFAVPVVGVNRLLSYVPHTVYLRMTHVRGRVSLYWPGRFLCIEDSGRGLCVQTGEKTPVALGDLVDIAGFPAMNGLNPTLTDAVFRVRSRAQPRLAASVTAAQALHGEEDQKLVQIEGTLIGKDRAAGDPTMLLSAGKFVFPVVLPDSTWSGAPKSWDEGSVLRVAGICSVQLATNETPHEGLSVPGSFRILLRSPRDVTVLHKPSWWTSAHLFPLLAAFLVMTLCVLGWVIVLRNRVSEQSAVIQRHNQSLRELSLRDGLTGIANRRRFDETLEVELHHAAHSTAPISLLLVDIDHFKALNDRCGHQRGDECLIQVATALASASLRQGDLVARYGGEEFAVILPACDEESAMALGERLRMAVLDLAIPHAGAPPEYCVSISVGVATASSPMAGRTELIGLADAALYEAKRRGRNRTVISATVRKDEMSLG